MGDQISPMPYRYHLGEVLPKPNILPLHLFGAPKFDPIYCDDSASLSNDFFGNFQFVVRLIFVDILVCQ
jgi:hypothetical protein